MKRITQAILLVSCALALVAVGTASGATVTDWDGTDPVTDEFEISNDTESLRVMAENITNDSAEVTVYGVENGSRTSALGSTPATIETNENPADTSDPVYTTTWEYDLSDPQYDRYNVSVSAGGADSLTIAKVNVVASSGGGGGILPGGGLGGLPTNELIAGAIVLVVAGSVIIYSRR